MNFPVLFQHAYGNPWFGYRLSIRHGVPMDFAYVEMAGREYG